MCEVDKKKCNIQILESKNSLAEKGHHGPLTSFKERMVFLFGRGLKVNCIRK